MQMHVQTTFQENAAARACVVQSRGLEGDHVNDGEQATNSDAGGCI